MCNLDNMKVARQPLPLQQPFDKLWLLIRKVIDRLHLRNHKKSKCKEDYNPDLLPETDGKLNTLVAEQTFVWAGRFKKIMAAMKKSHFMFFYHVMVKMRNRYTEKCHLSKREPLLPKIRSELTS